MEKIEMGIYKPVWFCKWEKCLRPTYKGEFKMSNTWFML